MLPGTPTRGNVHFLTTLRATGEPPPERFERDDRFHGRDGNGLGIGMLLIAAMVCGGVLAWVFGL